MKMSRKNNHWVKMSSAVWIKDYKNITVVILLDREAGLYGVMFKNKRGAILPENSTSKTTLVEAKRYADEVVKGM